MFFLGLVMMSGVDGFVSFAATGYTFNYCDMNDENGCDCYSNGYTKEYVACTTDGDVDYGTYWLWCQSEDKESCLGKNLVDTLEGCSWDSDAQSYFKESCDNGAIQWTLHFEQDCSDQGFSLSVQGWHDMESCDTN